MKVRQSSGWRMPAEWEHQYAVQLTWPHKDTDWKEMLDEICEVYVSLSLEILSYERLIIVSCEPQIAVDQISRGGASSEMLSRIDTVKCPIDDTWARDHGIITLKKDENEEKLLLDFCFNGWAGKYPSDKDNAINRHLFSSGVLAGSYKNHLDFVLEGGSVESDGRGTIFTTSCCLLLKGRNFPFEREYIEDQLCRRLCAKRVIWLDCEPLEGDDTDGHIDTLVRVAPHDTLLYSICEDPNDSQYDNLVRLFAQLKELKTLENKAYRLLPLPLPRAIFENKNRLPATYANFFVINNAVLCPVYGDKESDNCALNTLSIAYPDRKIIPINCLPIIRQRGSLHCCTMQYY